MRRTLEKSFGTRAAVLLAVLLAGLLAAAFALSGCARRPPVPEPVAERTEEPAREPAGEPDAGIGEPLVRGWQCVPADGSEGPPFAGRGESWVSEGGRLVSVHRSGPAGEEAPGRESPEDALEDAVESATASALELLEQRGVPYAESRRRDIIADAASAARRGAAIPFPRVAVVEDGVEECVLPAKGGADADTCWRAAVLVEYPIGYLRGDANNVRWERSRAANEARTLRASAREHLSSGRWFAGLLDAGRIADVVLATGIPVGATEAPPDSAAPASDPAVSDPVLAALVGELDWSASAARGAGRLEGRASGGVCVVEAGAVSHTRVEFAVSYRWDGREVAAGGVPVAFELPGASAVLDVEPVTDEAGRAVCRIVAAYGPPGEYELVLKLDAAAADAALRLASAGTAGPSGYRDAEGSAGGGTDAREPAELARVPVHVVSGAHAISVCADLGEPADQDAAQLLAGMTRRMERDGFRMKECGPEVDVVVTGRFTKSAREEPGGWVSTVTLTASAFDQRTASRLGETTISVSERVAESGSDGARRDSEVLALKEAGRLLAVYFRDRVLQSGG